MRLLRAVSAALIVALCGTAASAQIDQKISGTVRDQSGAWVTNATVTATNERTGEVRTAATNDKGFFVIGALKASSYKIKVEYGGFQPIEYDQMPLAVGQELALDFELKPTGVQEAVTVYASAPVLDISSA